MALIVISVVNRLPETRGFWLLPAGALQPHPYVWRDSVRCGAKGVNGRRLFVNELADGSNLSQYLKRSPAKVPSPHGVANGSDRAWLEKIVSHACHSGGQMKRIIL